MNQEPMLSVIVPVYKTEAYLPECIESILNQTYENFELILIDDGSPDSCPAICDTYAKKDPRIIVIHKENGGVSSARNEGIRQSRGKYLIFVDSDDYLENRMFEVMLRGSGAGVDCICASIRYVYQDVSRNTDCPLPSASIEMSEEMNHYFGQIQDNYGFSAPYAKLYKRDLILEKKLEFDQNFSILEDGIFVSSYLKHCRRCMFLSDILYNYRQAEEESLMKRFHQNADMALLAYYEQTKWVKEILDEENKKRFDYRVCSLFISFVMQIYYRSALTFLEKYRLLKRYAAVGKTVVCRNVIIDFALKHRILQFLLLNNMTFSAHLLLYFHNVIRKQ